MPTKSDFHRRTHGFSQGVVVDNRVGSDHRPRHGSIAEEFRRITAGKTGVSATPTVNPHNQTFAVAIQLGVVGAVVLWAMWIAHIALFPGSSALAWLGLVLVVENVLSSTVHSHLFDFNSGWLYVFGVGVLGGTILGERDSVSKKTEFG